MTFPFPSFSPRSAVVSTLVYRGSSDQGGNPTTHTYTSAPIGTAASDRLVIVTVLGHRANISPRSISSVTIGGNAATQIVATTRAGTSNSLTLAIYALVVTSGTTATVVVTYSGQLTDSSISVYTANPASSTATDTLAVNTGSSPSGLIDTSANGFIVAGFSGIEGTPDDIVMVGVTQDIEHLFGTTNFDTASGSLAGLSALANRTVSMSSGATTQALVAASWA